MRITNQKILEATKREILEAMKQGFESVDRRFESVDRRFEKVESVLKTLVTREEFNVFKVENLNGHANLATSIEKLDQEFTVFTAAHDRLEQRVDKHEKALVQHKILALDAR